MPCPAERGEGQGRRRVRLDPGARGARRPPAKFRFFVTCARGTEGALRRELAALRIAGAQGDAAASGSRGR